MSSGNIECHIFQEPKNEALMKGLDLFLSPGRNSLTELEKLIEVTIPIDNQRSGHQSNKGKKDKRRR